MAGLCPIEKKERCTKERGNGGGNCRAITHDGGDEYSKLGLDTTKVGGRGEPETSVGPGIQGRKKQGEKSNYGSLLEQ